MSTDVAPKAKENYIAEYVEAAVSSSSRARAVIIVMITASVLVIIPTWNGGGIWSDSEGWIDARIKLRTVALRLFSDLCYEPDPGLSEKEKDMNLRAGNLLANAGLNRYDPEHKVILNEEIKELKKIRREHLTVIHTPFFGAVFDVNDLGAFAGFTFVIVLLWLRFSLARELRNLKIAFNEAKSKGGELLRLCYHLLAMHQVLSVPPMPGEKARWARWFWVSIALSLYLVPALAYGYQLVSNWQTKEIGLRTSPANTTFQLRAGGVLFGLIIVLTFVCFIYHLRIDNEWRAVCENLEGGQPWLDQPEKPQSTESTPARPQAPPAAAALQSTRPSKRKSLKSRRR